MKLYRFKAGEIDYFAADTQADAVDAYKREYGIDVTGTRTDVRQKPMA